MKKLLVKILPIVASIGLMGAACPKVLVQEETLAASVEEAACAEVLEVLEYNAKEAEEAAAQEGAQLEIKNTVDHCGLLGEPFEDMGVMLLTSDMMLDGEPLGRMGFLIKFGRVGNEWVPMNMSPYYKFEAPQEKNAEDGKLDA